MKVDTVIEKRAGSVVGAELGCSVREENQAQRESYSADWRSVNIKTQPEDGQTVHAVDESRHESFSRQWEARPLVQGCPSGVIRLGTLDRGVREHQQLPYRNTLPLPIFTPAELGLRLGRGAPHTLEDLRAFPAPDGACPAKRDVADIIKDLPPAKPIMMEFAKAPRSLGRSMSQEAQRG
ncbi:telethonin-like [Megalops cyprinoides]|uniref:telethonin-like n=1 Tax=Megalops cyprinoides TaxID=118141 RepID=UPI0018645286|nr:telethonin-like [Megalops cyprinoides]